MDIEDLSGNEEESDDEIQVKKPAKKQVKKVAHKVNYDIAEAAPRDDDADFEAVLKLSIHDK